MKPKLLSKKQKNQIQFRNARLLDSSKSIYSDAVKSYFKYLVSKKLSEDFNINSIRDWLFITYRNSSTFNIRLQGIKEFYIKQYEGKPAIHRLRMREAFESVRRIQRACAKVGGIDYLSKKQVEQLSNKATTRISCFVLGIFWTGCRISELLNIQLSDCKIDKEVRIKILGKGNKERYVYLPISVFTRITRTFSGSTYLFEKQNGKQYGRCYVSREIKRQAQTKMRLNVHAHTLRHSKAMFLKARGLSPDQIARALGHSNVTTTLAYYLHGAPGAREQGIPRREDA